MFGLSGQRLQRKVEGGLNVPFDRDLSVLMSATPCVLSCQIVETVKNLRTEDGRLYAELFLVKPDPKLYPDYYEIISRPIAFNVIIVRAPCVLCARMCGVLFGPHVSLRVRCAPTLPCVLPRPAQQHARCGLWPCAFAAARARAPTFRAGPTWASTPPTLSSKRT